ncbi:MAG: hypothetical protein HZB54_07470 [Deltaproteobacteria bacterium]|nr:hypothetical protein [Deltaproteobacteria bacterium]
MNKKTEAVQGQGEDVAAVSAADNKAKKSCSSLAARRAFIKQAVVGGIAVSSVAWLAKAVVATISENTPDMANLKDNLKQERIMLNKEYAVMSKQEKEELVQIFINSYKEQA